MPALVWSASIGKMAKEGVDPKDIAETPGLLET